MTEFISVYYLDELEFEDLDLEFIDDILGEDSTDYSIILNGHEKYSWAGESEFISLESLKKLVNLMTDAHANYVEVFNHLDHHSVIFYPVTARKAGVDELSDHLLTENKKERERLQGRISELEKELNRLKNQLKDKK